jgi:serine/threonine protein kinase
MKYEFGNAVWMEETPEGELSRESIEKLHKETEEKIRASIEKLLESQANFLGKGRTAEVHFLEKDTKLCYKIIRKVEVLVRPDAVDNLPAKYREIYDEEKRKKEIDLQKPPSQREDRTIPWHVELYTEAEFLSRARKAAVDTSVKVPRPDATISIRGKEEGEGYEVIDSMDVLLMETMDAISVEDMIMKGELPPQNFNYDNFCEKMDEFIDIMHRNKLYHRDLHGGNVMVDIATGDPVVIDFGRAGISSEDEAYYEDVKPGMNLQFIPDETTFETKVKMPLQQYLKYKKLT